MSEGTTGTDIPPAHDQLLPQHQALIQESGISEEVAMARGYRSAITRAELKRLGFADRQTNVPALLIPVRGLNGDPVLYQVRPDNPRVCDGKPIKYETPRGARMTLDVPPHARASLGDPRVPLFITEGVRKADAGVSHGLCTIALLGVWNWRGTNDAGGKTALPEWESVALNGRMVYVVFDSDVMTKPQVGRALDRLMSLLESRGASPHAILLPAKSDGSKVGLDDFLAAGGSASQLLECVRTEPLSFHDATSAESGPSEERSDATILVELALELYDLGVDTGQTAFALDRRRPSVAMSVKGQLRVDLAKAFYQRFGRAAGGGALTDAQTILQGLAAETAATELHLRVGQHGSDIYLDLGRADGEMVRIAPGRWLTTKEPPILFRRTALTRELPIPRTGGSLHELRNRLNVTDATWPIVLGWLVAAFVPRMPHPILLLGGQQGVGKTTAAKLLLALVDPSAAPVRSPPANARQWAITAAASWCVCIDNVSEIKPWWSDALCKAVTGDGWLDRALYTDSDVSVLSFQRVISFTSIDPGSLRGDLGERVLLADLEPIPADRRRTEREILTDLEKVQPFILGALLDLVAQVLEELPRTSAAQLPRMADFAALLQAMDRVAGTTSFRIYCEQDVRIADEVVTSDPVATAILDLIEERPEGFLGTATTLLQLIGPQDPARDRTRTARALSGQLRRVVPALEKLGVTVVFFNENSSRRRRLIRISRTRPPDAERGTANAGTNEPLPRREDSQAGGTADA